MAGSDPAAAVEAVASSLGAALLGLSVDRGETILIVDRSALRDACRLLRDGEAGFNHLSNLCGVDYLAMGLEPRFAVVYHLYSPSLARRVSLKVPVEEGDATVPSIVELWPGADYHERETFDMYGIRFDGHPNLTRILMPDDATLHPLRKDVPVGGEEVEFSHNFGVSSSQSSGESAQ